MEAVRQLLLCGPDNIHGKTVDKKVPSELCHRFFKKTSESNMIDANTLCNGGLCGLCNDCKTTDSLSLNTPPRHCILNVEKVGAVGSQLCPMVMGDRRGRQLCQLPLPAIPTVTNPPVSELGAVIAVPRAWKEEIASLLVQLAALNKPRPGGNKTPLPLPAPTGSSAGTSVRGGRGYSRLPREPDRWRRDAARGSLVSSGPENPKTLGYGNLGELGSWVAVDQAPSEHRGDGRLSHETSPVATSCKRGSLCGFWKHRS